MFDTITFSVHRNPKNDPDAPDTYHVRHDTIATINREGIVKYLEENRNLRRTVVEPVISELANVVAEHLLDNMNVHIEGLGTFYLRLGFRHPENAPEDYKPRFTDPAEITGDNVCIEGLGFKPDKEFQSLLFKSGRHFKNTMGRGHVGHSPQYTDEQMRQLLDDYFKKNTFIDRWSMKFAFHLTDHMARKWLDRLTTQPNPYLICKNYGRRLIYEPVKKT